MKLWLGGVSALAVLGMSAMASAQNGSGSYGAQPNGNGAPAPACVLSSDGVTYVTADGAAVCTPSAAQVAASKAAPAAVPAGAVKPRKRLHKRARPCFNDCG